MEAKYNQDKKQCIFYLERDIYPLLLERGKKKGLSVSAYSRWVIKKSLQMKEFGGEGTDIENDIKQVKKEISDLQAENKLLKQAIAKVYGMVKPNN